MAIEKDINNKNAVSKVITENKERSLTTQFLLTEFSELAEAWRHTDARIESAINIYLTIAASTFPALGLLYQAFQSLRLFILISIPVLITLFVFGFLFTQRVTSTDIIKAEYILGMKMIRRYFIDHDAEISAYIFLPVASPAKDHQEREKQKHPSFHKQLIYAVIVFNSLLVGAIVGSLAWLIFVNIFITSLISFGCIIVALVFLSRHYQRRIKRTT